MSYYGAMMKFRDGALAAATKDLALCWAKRMRLEWKRTRRALLKQDGTMLSGSVTVIAKRHSPQWNAKGDFIGYADYLAWKAEAPGDGTWTTGRSKRDVATLILMNRKGDKCA